MISRYFLNLREKRLRTGWRILVFASLLYSLLALLVLLLRHTDLLGNLEPEVLSAVLGTLVAVVASVGVYVCRRFVDKKSLVSLGIRADRDTLGDLLFGFVLSGLLVGTIVVALYSFGWLRFDTVPWTGKQTVSWIQLLLLFTGVGASVAWWEEFAMRGYLLQNLRDGVGLTYAIVISCISYGAMHMANPNSSWVSGVLVGAIGYLRIFGWLRTDQLWLSMGMHAGWNFFLGPVFGFSVSGHESASLFKHSLSGPSWATGGSFGPEAGLIVVPVIIVGLASMYFWTARREKQIGT
jgi:membrane protease YdiL (CAAX protease family)